MSEKNKAVFGIYSSGEHAERAVDMLTAAGFASPAISVDGRVKNGGTLLSVHCDTAGQISRAKDLLKSSGAEDIASTGESASTEPAASAATYR
jgi:hypothetical protein